MKVHLLWFNIGDNDSRDVMTDKELAEQTSLLSAVLIVTDLYEQIVKNISEIQYFSEPCRKCFVQLQRGKG